MKKNEKYMTKYLKERYNEERTTLTLVNSNSLLTETKSDFTHISPHFTVVL